MPKLKKPGEALQNLVAALEAALADQENVEIESPGWLKDKDTGQRREHDVLIRWKQGHHTIIGAIECRDRSRKIGVNEVEGFASKCTRTGVDVPMMVSSKGFTETGRIKAASLGIRCMELLEAESFDWAGLTVFIELKKVFSPIDVNVFLVADAIPVQPLQLFDSAGTEMGPANYAWIIEQGIKLPENLEELVGQVLPITAHVNTIGWTAKDALGGKHTVSHIVLQTSLTVERTVQPVALHSYNTEGGRYEVASSQVTLGDKSGNLLMVRGEDGGIKVMLKVDEPD